MNYPKVLYCYPAWAGKSFEPSNGTEGDIFISAFCERCVHEKFMHTQNHADKKCDIFSASIIYWHDSKNADKYPKEWVFNAEGWPVCTAWVKWDWGMDDDGNWNNPPEPEPEDPNQLCIPFILNDITGEQSQQHKKLIYG